MEFGAERFGKARMWGQVLQPAHIWKVATWEKKPWEVALGKVNKIYISRCSAEFYIYDTMLLDVSAHCYDGNDDHRLEVLMASL